MTLTLLCCPQQGGQADVFREVQPARQALGGVFPLTQWTLPNAVVKGGEKGPVSPPKDDFCPSANAKGHFLSRTMLSPETETYGVSNKADPTKTNEDRLQSTDLNSPADCLLPCSHLYGPGSEDTLTHVRTSCVLEERLETVCSQQMFH